MKNIDERVAILLSEKGYGDSWVPVGRKRGAFFDGNSLANETEMTIKEKPGAAVSKLSGVVQIYGLFDRVYKSNSSLKAAEKSLQSNILQIITFI